MFEETIDTELKEQQETDKRLGFCEPCFIDGVMNVIALYFCIVCGRYFCEKCFTGHNRSHKYIRAESKDRELESEIADFVSFMMNESDDESEKKLFEDDVYVCDYVDTKHGLDKDKDYFIRGLTGYAYKWWVACDSSNRCIKVFSLGSNVLQRYIRLGSSPEDVTEIIVESKTTEQDSASCSEITISETDNKPDRKHLLAVTLPWERLILIIDLGKNQAVIHSKIETEKRCHSIDFYDGHIYIACRELFRDSPRSVYILSLEGVTLKTFQTDIPDPWSPYLTVLNGNIYMIDSLNHSVVCYNDEGRVLHEIRIDRLWPEGICVDRSEDKVYVSSFLYGKVYELESDLTQYKPVLDQTSRYMESHLSRYKPVLDQPTRYIENPTAICFYSDKLYVGHFPGSEPRSHVTVVRLL